jgi:glycosyltransferase involved in cell wall biosynthesis
MSRRPLVCLVDAHDNGHHPMYAGVYSTAFAALGADVWLVAPGSLVRAMPPLGGAAVTVLPWDTAPILSDSAVPADEKAMRLWRSLGEVLDVNARAVKQYPDYLVHLFIDSFITELMPSSAIDAHVHCPFAGLWFKPPRPLGWSVRDVVKQVVRWGRRYASLRSSRWDAILLLDTTGYGHLARGGQPRIVGVPEFSVPSLPAVEPAIIKEIREHAAGRRVCSLVGSLEGRKGVRAFLRSAAVAPKDEWFFVMAGKVAWDTFDAETRETLERLRSGTDGRVYLVDRWFDDETLNAIVAASGLLHACYERWPYSSNMLCKAAAFRVPVIVADEGYLGRKTAQYGLGFTVSEGRQMPGRFVTGFAADVSSFGARQAFVEGCSRYVADNSPDALVSTLRQDLWGSIVTAAAHQT